MKQSHQSMSCEIVSALTDEGSFVPRTEGTMAVEKAFVCFYPKIWKARSERWNQDAEGRH